MAARILDGEIQLTLRENDDIEEDRTIKNLSFSGGGLKAFTFLGALKALEENDIMEGVEVVAGTSAGAILATLIACGMNYQNCRLMLQSCVDHFKQYEVSWLNIFRNAKSMKNKYGLFKTNEVRNYFQEMIKKCIEENTDYTFKELFEKTGKKLIITATCVQTHSPFYFSPETTPNTPVSQALTISVNIPFLFECNYFEDKAMVDGAVIESLPMKCWEPDEIKNTLAFLCKSEKEYFDFVEKENDIEYDINSMFDFLEHIFITLRKGIDERYYTKYKDTIILLHCGIIPYIEKANYLTEEVIDTYIYSAYFQTLHSLKKKNIPLIVQIPEQSNLTSYIEMEKEKQEENAKEVVEEKEDEEVDSMTKVILFVLIAVLAFVLIKRAFNK